MTIASLVNRNDAIGNGVTTEFPYAFRIFQNTDLLVLTRVVGAAAVVKVLTTDYTVTNVGNANGGNVVFLVAPVSAIEIAIIRRRPLTQTTDIRNQGPFLPELHEDEFDDQTMVDQQLDEAIDRSLKLPDIEAGSVLLTELPSLEARKGLILGFDGTTGAPVGRSQGSAPAEILWQIRGAVSLADNPFPQYRARKNLTLLTFDIQAVVAGTGGSSVFTFKKNGSTVATVTLAAGALFGTATANVQLADGDTLNPEWTIISPTTPPETVTIAARI